MGPFRRLWCLCFILFFVETSQNNLTSSMDVDVVDSSSSSSSPTIITSPPAGYSAAVATVLPIRWTREINDTVIAFTLVKAFDGSFAADIDQTVATSLTRLNWLIPPLPTDNYAVEVCLVQRSPPPCSYSESFHISNTAFISPKQDDELLIGDEWEVEWITGENAGLVKLQFVTASRSWTVAVNAKNNETFLWTVPMFVNSAVLKGSLRLTTPYVTAQSEQFQILDGSVIPPLIVLPSSDTRWRSGDTVSILWQRRGSYRLVTIELFVRSTLVMVLSNHTLNSGNLSLIVPNVTTGGDEFVVRVSSADNRLVYDLSSPFSIFSVAEIEETSSSSSITTVELIAIGVMIGLLVSGVFTLVARRYIILRLLYRRTQRMVTEMIDLEENSQQGEEDPSTGTVSASPRSNNNNNSNKKKKWRKSNTVVVDDLFNLPCAPSQSKESIQPALPPIQGTGSWGSLSSVFPASRGGGGAGDVTDFEQADRQFSISRLNTTHALIVADKKRRDGAGIAASHRLFAIQERGSDSLHDDDNIEVAQTNETKKKDIDAAWDSAKAVLSDAFRADTPTALMFSDESHSLAGGDVDDVFDGLGDCEFSLSASPMSLSVGGAGFRPLFTEGAAESANPSHSAAPSRMRRALAARALLFTREFRRRKQIISSLVQSAIDGGKGGASMYSPNDAIAREQDVAFLSDRGQEEAAVGDWLRECARNRLHPLGRRVQRFIDLQKSKKDRIEAVKEGDIKTIKQILTTSIAELHGFLEEMRLMVASDWQQNLSDPSFVDALPQILEETLLPSISDSLFSLFATVCEEEDWEFRKQCATLAILPIDKFEIPMLSKREISSEAIEEISKGLLRLRERPTPSAKLFLVADVCDAMSRLLETAVADSATDVDDEYNLHVEGGGGGERKKKSKEKHVTVGADDLLPALCRLVVLANPPQFVSHVRFCSDLLPSNLAVGKEGYILAMLHTVLIHISTMIKGEKSQSKSSSHTFLSTRTLTPALMDIPKIEEGMQMSEEFCAVFEANSKSIDS